MITMSKSRLIGNALFLTIGPYTAAQVGLHNPPLLWPAMFLMLGVRFGVNLVVQRLKKGSAHDALRLHALAVEGKPPVEELAVFAGTAQ